MKVSVITPTHDPKWLAEAAKSLARQSFGDFEWVLSVNIESPNHDDLQALKLKILGVLDRTGVMRGEKLYPSGGLVRIVIDSKAGRSVGQRKRFAFGAAAGDYLVELDHDDILRNDALEKVAQAFDSSPDVGFVYSDFVDIDTDTAMGKGQGTPAYLDPVHKPKWIQNGYEFYETADERGQERAYIAARAFEPSAVSFSTIYWAPNHLRAWRRSVYESVGGHDPRYAVCDDHDLLCRTYLATVCLRIPEALYFYRYTGSNTSNANEDIRKLTWELHEQYLERLVLREGELGGWPCYVLDPDGEHKGWTSAGPRGVVSFSLNDKRLPFEDGSVWAFRSVDFLTRVSDKDAIMSEIWRCLRPGGWLLSETPSADGRGAFQDPRSISYWNANSFLYYTHRNYLNRPGLGATRFQIMAPTPQAHLYFPTTEHNKMGISYVRANLIARKEGSGYKGPGVIYY